LPMISVSLKKSTASLNGIKRIPIEAIRRSGGRRYTASSPS
jgi:hypothetical protein